MERVRADLRGEGHDLARTYRITEPPDYDAHDSAILVSVPQVRFIPKPPRRGRPRHLETEHIIAAAAKQMLTNEPSPYKVAQQFFLAKPKGRARYEAYKTAVKNNRARIARYIADIHNGSNIP
jgi:hypothetical protein